MNRKAGFSSAFFIPLNVLENVVQWAWDKRVLHSEGSQSKLPIKILSSGVWNQDGPGPDFQNAVIEFDGLIWHGSIEIHIKASDWYRHKHHLDPNYDNVILHIVAINDQTVLIHGIPIVTYVIDPSILKYLAFIKNLPSQDLPCTFHKHVFSTATLHMYWIKRMHRKKKENGPSLLLVQFLLGEMDEIPIIPLKTRQRKNREIISALYEVRNNFQRITKKENTGLWQSLANHLQSSPLTKFERINILNNGLVPLLINENNTHELARYCMALPAENNRITRKYQKTGNTPKNAFESHAIMEIYRQLCSQSACLSCERGEKIIHT